MKQGRRPQKYSRWFFSFEPEREFEASDIWAAHLWLVDQCYRCGTVHDPHFEQYGPYPERCSDAKHKGMGSDDDRWQG